MVLTEHLQRDSGGERTESKGLGLGTADWRIWLTSPRHLALAVAVALFGGLLIGYVVAALAIFPPQGVASDLKTVPRLVGRTADEARRSVERLGLIYEEGAAIHHPEIHAGTVLAQDPLPGQRASAGSAILVTLSLGVREHPVPEVIGLGHNQAEIALERAGFDTDLTWVDAEANVGQVVGTQPIPGTAVTLPSTVQLIVSAGPPAVAVPDLVTRSSSEAQSALERLGLRLGSVSEDSTSLAAPGTVIEQAPGVGTVVERGTRISVTVAALPPPLEADTSAEVPAAAPDSAADGETRDN